MKIDKKVDSKGLKCPMPIVELSSAVNDINSGEVIEVQANDWAFVDIFAESKLIPQKNYYLIYDHLQSFEAVSWIASDKDVDRPVCFMNSGCLSGWFEESFGVELVAKEIFCRVKTGLL